MKYLLCNNFKINSHEIIEFIIYPCTVVGTVIIHVFLPLLYLNHYKLNLRNENDEEGMMGNDEGVCLHIHL